LFFFFFVVAVSFTDVFFHVVFTAPLTPEGFTVVRPALIEVFGIRDGISAVGAQDDGFRGVAVLAKPVVFLVVSATFSFSAHGAFFVGINVRSVAVVHHLGDDVIGDGEYGIGGKVGKKASHIDCLVWNCHPPIM
jgi:hypothetical protein